MTGAFTDENPQCCSEISQGVWNMLDCWGKPFSAAMINTMLSKVVLLKMVSKCAWNLQFRETLGSHGDDYDNRCFLD